MEGTEADIVAAAPHGLESNVLADQSDEILRFVRFWRRRTGRFPEELIFDSKLTTRANLDELNRLGIGFITLRRRSAKTLDEIRQTPPSAWRRTR